MYYLKFERTNKFKLDRKILLFKYKKLIYIHKINFILLNFALVVILKH